MKHMAGLSSNAGEQNSKMPKSKRTLSTGLSNQLGRPAAIPAATTAMNVNTSEMTDSEPWKPEHSSSTLQSRNLNTAVSGAEQLRPSKHHSSRNVPFGQLQSKKLDACKVLKQSAQKVSQNNRRTTVR